MYPVGLNRLRMEFASLRGGHGFNAPPRLVSTDVTHIETDGQRKMGAEHSNYFARLHMRIDEYFSYVLTNQSTPMFVCLSPWRVFTWRSHYSVTVFLACRTGGQFWAHLEAFLK